jgi:hypothetical protein
MNAQQAIQRFRIKSLATLARLLRKKFPSRRQNKLTSKTALTQEELTFLNFTVNAKLHQRETTG